MLHFHHPVLLPGARARLNTVTYERVWIRVLSFAHHPVRATHTATERPPSLEDTHLLRHATHLARPTTPAPERSQVFDQYAMETAVDQIFGNQVTNLRGVGYLFRTGAFLYSLFVIAALTALVRRVSVAFWGERLMD